MKRLTERFNDGKCHISELHIDSEYWSDEKIDEIADRLAGYEDILFDDDGNEQISFDRLREIVEAEKDGRLVVLPCKVGDTVWIHALVPCGACPHGADQAKICGQAGCPIHPIPVSFNVRMFDGIGKTVFLTREEAEAALKGGEENA